MKFIVFLLTLVFVSKVSALGEQISCGEHRSENNPNKLAYKFQVSSEYSQDYEAFFKKVGEIPVEEVSRYYELLDRGTFIYKKGFGNMSMRGDDGKVIIEHQTIQPSFSFKAGDSTIIGFSNGEFGGELLRVANDDSIHHIAEINVEDIYQTEFGIIITSGLAHMSSNQGMIYILNDNFELDKLYGLVGAPVSSWVLQNLGILINSYPEGYQLLQNDGSLIRVECKANK